MKRIKLLFSIAGISVLAASLGSCDDFLDVKTIQADVTVDALYQRYTYARGVIWEAYSYLPSGYEDLWREAATDVAEATSESASSQLFNKGLWNQFSNPDGVWSRNFSGIDQANRYLQHKDEVDLENILTSATETDSTAYKKALSDIVFMEGEALFLKAFFYFDLVKRYGGVPIFDTPLDFYDESTWKNISRASIDDCFKYIVRLCDQAAAILPEKMTAYSWYEDGRVTHGAIKALKAKALFYAASPLYKDAGATASWSDAAAALHDVIALKQYSLSAYAALFGSGNAVLPEVIFKKRRGNFNWLEQNQFPISYVGSNGSSLTPTQNFVDQFEIRNTTNGQWEDFDWSNTRHSANPYRNRDPRFAATVLYNGLNFNSKPIETFVGGVDGLPKQNATKTGYYLAKWVNPGVDLVNNTSVAHTWIYIRYADILLMYAEAMFNAYGATTDPEGYGLTALQAFNQVRKRAGVAELTAATLNQARIERERLLELAFEDQRFWDVRRWKKGTEYFNKPVTRIIITKDGTAFTYETKELESRIFSEKMNWYPISQSEIAKTGWEQNPKW
jgi:hypothetical protein